VEVPIEIERGARAIGRQTAVTVLEENRSRERP
jgi:hypothetical protein